MSHYSIAYETTLENMDKNTICIHQDLPTLMKDTPNLAIMGEL